MVQAHPERASSETWLPRSPLLAPTGAVPLALMCMPPSLAHGGVEATRKKARRSGWAVAVAAAFIALAGPCRAGPAADPQGVWMIEDEVALAVSDCGGGALCGRIVWLRTPRDDAGRPKRDEMNPDAALRDRPLCGLTVLDGLLPVPDEPGRWAAGSFYDPRNGRTYGLAATHVSADVLVARVYTTPSSSMSRSATW